jgi:membrane-associated phospholipid phosphatase
MTMAFAVFTAIRISGATTHYDLRIVAHLVPVRDHTRLLKLIHPLVHLADAWFVLGATVLVVVVLWLRGYRRVWALLLTVLLTWVIEVGCKALFPQPAALFTAPSSVQMRDLVHGPGTAAFLDWLHQAAPTGVGTLVSSAGGATLGLASSYPSGTAARGAFVIGLIGWACLRLGGVGAGVLLAGLLVVPLSTLGLAVVLYAWHWPSDVVGGYLLGLGLLAIGLACLRRPTRIAAIAQPPPQRKGPHSPHSRLPWVVNAR